MFFSWIRSWFNTDPCMFLRLWQKLVCSVQWCLLLGPPVSKHNSATSVQYWQVSYKWLSFDKHGLSRDNSTLRPIVLIHVMGKALPIRLLDSLGFVSGLHPTHIQVIINRKDYMEFQPRQAVRLTSTQSCGKTKVFDHTTIWMVVQQIFIMTIGPLRHGVPLWHSLSIELGAVSVAMQCYLEV